MISFRSFESRENPWFDIEIIQFRPQLFIILSKGLLNDFNVRLDWEDLVCLGLSLTELRVCAVLFVSVKYPGLRTKETKPEFLDHLNNEP